MDREMTVIIASGRMAMKVEKRFRSSSYSREELIEYRSQQGSGRRFEHGRNKHRDQGE